jgi:hypothetical protein
MRMKFSRREFLRDFVLAGGCLFLSPSLSCAEIIKRAQWQPGYAKLEKEGKLTQRVRQAHAIFERCQLCPRKCGVNRLKGEKGFCQAPARVVIYSSSPFRRGRADHRPARFRNHLHLQLQPPVHILPELAHRPQAGAE